MRVADRLLSAAERAITAGSVEDAKKMVAVAETLTPATARGAFLMMQIEREHERAALTRAKDSDAQDKLEKGATYLRLAKRACAAARSSNLPRTTRGSTWKPRASSFPTTRRFARPSARCRRQLLDRASAAANAGNAAETERWLANADSAGAARQDMASIRRSLHDTRQSARAPAR